MRSWVMGQFESVAFDEPPYHKAATPITAPSTLCILICDLPDSIVLLVMIASSQMWLCLTVLICIFLVIRDLTILSNVSWLLISLGKHLFGSITHFQREKLHHAWRCTPLMPAEAGRSLPVYITSSRTVRVNTVRPCLKNINNKIIDWFCLLILITEILWAAEASFLIKRHFTISPE